MYVRVYSLYTYKNEWVFLCVCVGGGVVVIVTTQNSTILQPEIIDHLTESPKEV